MVWPASLQELACGWQFNQPIEGIAFPAGLQKLIFGQNLKQLLKGVLWSTSLEKVQLALRCKKRILTEGVESATQLCSILSAVDRGLRGQLLAYYKSSGSICPEDTGSMCIMKCVQ